MTNRGLRLGFAGTPELAAVILQALLDDTSCTISWVFTQPDRPAGRGRKLEASHVKQLAEAYKIPVRQPSSSSAFDPDNILIHIDALIVAAYGIILPAEILQRPQHGCINVHTSLLPRWRGAAPVQRAIQAGDDKTGITIMQIDTGLDTGDILLQSSCKILPNDTAGTLHDRLAVLGGKTLLKALADLQNGNLIPHGQDNKQATRAEKISKSEALIDWSESAVQIERNIRAFNPAPVAHTRLNGLEMRIYEAAVVPNSDPSSGPGNVIACNKSGIDVATGAGILRIKALQLSGKKVISARDFFNSNLKFSDSH